MGECLGEIEDHFILENILRHLRKRERERSFGIVEKGSIRNFSKIVNNFKLFCNFRSLVILIGIIFWQLSFFIILISLTRILFS